MGAATMANRFRLLPLVPAGDRLRAAAPLWAAAALGRPTMAAGVKLRAVEDGDLPTFFAHHTDPAAYRMAVVGVRARDDFDAHWAKVRADPTNRVRTIVVGGQVAGYVCAFDQGGERQVGYWVGRDFWGRGVATASLAAFLDVEPHRPLHAHAAVVNVGSTRVLEKCGFRRVGTLEAVSVRGGPAVDEAVYRLG